MKRTIVLAAVIALASATSAQAALLFQASLDSDQEVAPGGATNSPLTGMADLVLTNGGPGNNHLAFTIVFESGVDFTGLGGGGSGVEATNIHFHNEVRGVNGGVVFGIFGPSHDTDGDTTISTDLDGVTTITGEWDSGEGATDLDSFIAHLLGTGIGEDADLYLNLHTDTDSVGLIRGQLVGVPEPSTALLALLGAAGLALGVARRRRG